jgi:hypothetical protein
MELSAYALHEDAALVLCRGHGTRKSPRRLDERGHGYILISVGRRVSPVEPSEEKCHNDRACGRIHPCRSEA